ncbi:MAG: hypothetical protein ACOC04_06645 [Halothece sp.]
MPNKRSRYQKTPKFYCPYCQERLWRFGNEKYNIVYQDAASIKQSLGISSKKAKLLATKGAYLDSRSWLEAFFCRDDGKIWMLVSKRQDNSYEAIIAQPNHWKQANSLIDPDNPNPSVSEYSYRASRGVFTS